MTIHEAAVVSAYTGFLIGKFSNLHEYVEKILGHSVWTHELADADLVEKIKQLSKSDFIALNIS